MNGQQLKQEGMERALSKYEEWKGEFYDAALVYASAGTPFTSEDVLDVVGLPSGEPGLHKNNAVGAMMYSLARRGYIKKTGRHVPSRRSLSHGAELTQWIGAEHSPSRVVDRLAKIGTLHRNQDGICVECQQIHPCATYALYDG